MTTKKERNEEKKMRRSEKPAKPTQAAKTGKPTKTTKPKAAKPKPAEPEATKPKVAKPKRTKSPMVSFSLHWKNSEDNDDGYDDYEADDNNEGKELVGLTLTPLSIDSRMSILSGKPLSGLHPDDPGNLFDNPGIAGPAVEAWVRKFYRHHTGKELVPKGRGPDRVPEAGPRAEAVAQRLRGRLERLKAVIEKNAETETEAG